MGVSGVNVITFSNAMITNRYEFYLEILFQLVRRCGMKKGRSQ